MAVYPQLLAMLTGEANIANTQADTQQRMMDILQRKQQMDRENKFFEGWQRENAPGAPTVNAPIGSVEAEASKSYGLDKNNPLVQDVTMMQTEVNNQRKRYQTAMGAGWATMAESANKDLLSAEGKLIDARQNLNKHIEQVSKEAANVIGGVKDQESQDNAIRYVAQNVSPDAARKIIQSLPRDGEGYPIYDPVLSPKALAPFRDRYTTAYEQRSLEHQKFEEGRQLANDEFNKKAKQEELRLANVRAATAQAGLRLREKALGEMSGRKDFNQQLKIVQTDQADIKKLGQDSKLMEYKKGFDVATRVADELTSKGYEAVDVAQARTLIDQAKLMNNNYRSMGGMGRWTDQQFGQMNGMLQKVQKWVDTVGRGQMIVAPKEMLQVARNMQQMYADRNADVLETELKIAQGTAAKKANPTLLRFNGSIDQAIADNRAQKVLADDGNEYIVFGKVQGKKFVPLGAQHTYPVPRDPGLSQENREFLRGLVAGGGEE